MTRLFVQYLATKTPNSVFPAQQYKNGQNKVNFFANTYLVNPQKAPKT